MSVWYIYAMKRILVGIFTTMLTSMVIAQTQEQQVDALFANWNKQDTPGAAIEVIRNGKVLLRKGYGMADLERGHSDHTIDSVQYWLHFQAIYGVLNLSASPGLQVGIG